MTVAADAERPLRTADVAHMFGVTSMTVVRWADEGVLPSFRTPGGHRRFRPDDVAQLLESLATRREAAAS